MSMETNMDQIDNADEVSQISQSEYSLREPNITPRTRRLLRPFLKYVRERFTNLFYWMWRRLHSCSRTRSQREQMLREDMLRIKKQLEKEKKRALLVVNDDGRTITKIVPEIHQPGRLNTQEENTHKKKIFIAHPSKLGTQSDSQEHIDKNCQEATSGQNIEDQRYRRYDCVFYIDNEKPPKTDPVLRVLPSYPVKVKTKNNLPENRAESRLRPSQEMNSRRPNARSDFPSAGGRMVQDVYRRNNREQNIRDQYNETFNQDVHSRRQLDSGQHSDYDTVEDDNLVKDERFQADTSEDVAVKEARSRESLQLRMQAYKQYESIRREEQIKRGCLLRGHQYICPEMRQLLLSSIPVASGNQALSPSESFSCTRPLSHPPISFIKHSIMASQEEHERKIIIEFCHLLEKSKQLFNGLRELPPYGHKQWHVHFGKTFDVYTKLWKFQQQHRELLDTKYGLKRWQIGEIASKIGQLYYHFYLRTSDTAYLNEAFAFYYAIRGRSYYTRACREDRSELMVKKLRYYARFMVVCILLKKMKLVKELIKELHKQIIEYGNIYDPDDQIEWSLVLNEVKAFVRAEPGVVVLNSENNEIVLTHRLSPLFIPPIERIPQMNLKLQEALIVGSYSQQVKFSELTMDMFRILQIIEREPTGDMHHGFEEPPRHRYSGPPEMVDPKDGPPRRETGNPHKFLLYKPSPNQVMVYLASSCDELTPNGAVLLYLSAEGHSVESAAAAAAAAPSTSTARPMEQVEFIFPQGFDTGGLITTSKSDIYREDPKEPRSSQNKCKEGQCLYPGDLHPFTRKPLFIIVDSDNSFAFDSIPRHFGQPLVILMSPIALLPALQERRYLGNLFTLFLQAPVEGLALSCELDSIPLHTFDRCQGMLRTFMAETNAVLARTRLDSNYYPFLGDDFLRTILFRYIFCETTLRMHRGFRHRSNYPRCNPPIPEEVYDRPSLVDLVLEISNCLMVRNCFHDTYLNGTNTNL